MIKNRSVLKVIKVVGIFGGDRQKLIRELERLLREGKRAGDLIQVGAAYCCLAEACQDADDFRGTLSNSLQAVALLKDSGEYEMIARAYIALGKAYSYLENHQMALICDEIVYDIVKKHRIKGELRINALNNLSVSVHMMGDTKKGIRYLNECIELMHNCPEKDFSDLAMYTLNLAEYHKDSGDTEVAMEVLQSMSAWLDKVEFMPLVCDYYLRCAILYYTIGNRDAGDSYTDKGFAFMPENVYPLPIYDDLRKLAHFHAENGDRARADKILGYMTVYAEKTTGTVGHLLAVRMMADYYKQFGDYKRATEYYTDYETLNENYTCELRGMQMKMHETTQYAEAEISKLKQKMRKNEELVSIEPLTKLLNRSALLRISSEFIETAAKKKQKVGAIFIDIDFFKECNDNYGHAKGDEIIKEVARACKKQEASNIRFARYGGDEFFGITRGLTDDEVSDIARRIAQTIRLADIPNVKNPNGGRITLSVGVVNVAITDKTNNILEIANYADKAMYCAKNVGKNAICRLEHDEKEKGAGTSFVRIDF